MTTQETFKSKKQETNVMQERKRLVNTLQVHPLVVTNLSAFKSLHSVHCFQPAFNFT